MGSNNTFLLLIIKERNGEFEYLHRSVHVLKDNNHTIINSFVNDYIKTFYGGKSESKDEGYFFFNESVFVTEYSRKIISEEHYNILSQYL
jgi:hypothetical protein